MGCGYNLHCEKCDYRSQVYFGVGLMSPEVYEKTVQQAKLGELGAELKNFFAEHPDGAIDISYSLGVCKKCGEIYTVEDLSMYLPKDNFSPYKNHGSRSVAAPFHGAEYVSPTDLKEHYELFAKYPHECRCGGEMKIFNEDDFQKIRYTTDTGVIMGISEIRDFDCPRCHGKILVGSGTILWD